MGEAKRKRFASIEGPGSAAVAGLSDDEQAVIHGICVMAAVASTEQMRLIAAQATELHEEQGTNAALSAALHGLARFAWGIRHRGIERKEITRMMMMGIEHALAQAEASELMGGPVQGNG